jgi:hypothetical protein
MNPEMLYPKTDDDLARRFLSVSQAARQLNANPKDITNLFYGRQLRDDLCPVVAGRRLIPPEYVPMIAAALRRAGKLPPLSSIPQETPRIESESKVLHE